MNLIGLSETRARLTVAEADARKALTEFGQIARLLINGELQAPTTSASIAAMGERIQILRHALHDLEDIYRTFRYSVEPRGATTHEVTGGRCAPGPGLAVVAMAAGELPPRSEPPPHPIRILFLENHEVFARTVIQAFLPSEDVIVVSTIAAALDAVADRRFDIALVDFDLDDGKGVRFITAVRVSNPELRIIAVSARDHGNSALVLAGAHAVCKKGDFRKIAEVIASVRGA